MVHIFRNVLFSERQKQRLSKAEGTKTLILQLHFVNSLISVFQVICELPHPPGAGVGRGEAVAGEVTGEVVHRPGRGETSRHVPNRDREIIQVRR